MKSELSREALARESLALFQLAGKISRGQYLEKMKELAARWDNLVRDESGDPFECATFKSEGEKLAAYYRENSLNLEKIPENSLWKPEKMAKS